MTNRMYKIRNQSFQLISDVYPNGDMISEVGRVFDTNGEALEFLIRRQTEYLASGHYIDISKYTIVEFYITEYSHVKCDNFVESTIMNNEYSDSNVKKVKTIAKSMVQQGFNCVSSQFLNFLLTDDKYQLIMTEIIPPHMLYSTEVFMDCGIQDCDLDVLGSISLTATSEQLRIHNIEGVLRSRSENISK